MGGRPKGAGDYGELAVARMLGRNLSKREGCVVQLVTILAVAGALIWFVQSGLFFSIVKVVSEWYASQIHLPGAPTPTPGL